MLATMLKLYGGVLARAGRAAVRNWRLALVTPLYLLVMNLAAQMVAPLGRQLGGLALGLVQAACLGLYLHLMEEAVREGGRVTWSDFRGGFGAYFWQVIRILFLFTIVGFLVRPLIADDRGAILYYLATLIAGVALNAVPELLYVEREESFAALGASVRFIQQNWIEWFVPVLAGGWILVALDPFAWRGGIDPTHLGLWDLALNPLHQVEIVAMRLAYVRPGAPELGASGLLSALVFYYLMLVRGFLFRALNAHSQRTRIYRHRMGLD